MRHGMLGVILILWTIPTVAQSPSSQSVSQSTTSQTVIPGCEADDNAPTPSAPLEGKPRTTVVFNELARLRPDSGLSLTLFDGRHCKGRYVAAAAGRIAVKVAKQTLSLDLRGVRLIEKHEPFWRHVGGTSLEGAKVAGGPMLSMCTGSNGAAGGNIACAFGAFMAGFGAVFGAGYAAIEQPFLDGKRVYERSL